VDPSASSNDRDAGTGLDAGVSDTDAGTAVDAALDVGADVPHVKDPPLGLSAGCGNAAAGTGLQTRTITVGGTQRTYLRFIPPAYKPNKGIALVLALHGSGGTAQNARTSFDLEAAANGKAIFIYPEALADDPNFPGTTRWTTAKDSRDYAYLDALIAEVEASHCVDRDRVFVTGFSHGARMTSMLGCYRGPVLRAIAPVAAGGEPNTLPLNPSDCVGEVGDWQGVGTEDPDHIPGSTLVRDFYLAANGCASTTKPTTPAGCTVYDGCRAEVPVHWCTYPGGHMWPSIGAAGVWGFFSAFP
jgi:poly(3-hydroxybutyrate) depolymerase